MEEEEKAESPKEPDSMSESVSAPEQPNQNEKQESVSAQAQAAIEPDNRTPYGDDIFVQQGGYPPPVSAYPSPASSYPLPPPQTTLPTATVAYDAGMLTAFSRHVSKPAMMLLLSCGVFFAMLSMLIFVLDLEVELFLRSILLFFGLFGLVFPLTFFFFVIPRSARKSPQLQWGVITTFIFGEQMETYEHSRVTSPTHQAFAWVVLQKATEDAEYFFLYISRAQAFIIPKAAIKNCTPDEFRNLLRWRLGARYKGK